MHLLPRIARRLHDKVKEKFFIEIQEHVDDDLKPLNIETNDPIWLAKDKVSGKSLFTELIAKDGEVSKPQYLYKTVLYEDKSDKQKKDRSLERTITIGDKYLLIFLTYLGIEDSDSLEDRLIDFCNNDIRNSESNDKDKITEEDLRNQKLLPKERIRINNEPQIPKEDLLRIAELRKELGKLMYKYTKLLNTKWWFYFHGYERYKLKAKKQNTWTLVKLVLSFGDMTENGEVELRLDNKGIEHYDYAGLIDLQSSRLEVLVANLYTLPYFGRQLNIKIHVGNGEGELFLGQYLNYESDSHIISGNIILERINEKKNIHCEPASYIIDNPENGHEYTEEIDKVSPYILQYLHDKKQNFRRTPLRVGHTIGGLKQWLETRKLEENY